MIHWAWLIPCAASFASAGYVFSGWWLIGRYVRRRRCTWCGGKPHPKRMVCDTCIESVHNGQHAGPADWPMEDA